MNMQHMNEQPQIKSTPYQSPMYNYSSAIMFLTNPQDEVFKLELTLRNQIPDKDGNPRQVGKPLLNDEGICAIIGMIQVVVNQVTIMSNLSKNEVPSLIDFLADTLAKDLMINCQRYDLNPHDRDKVFFSVLSAAYICMKRAYEEGDKRFWKGSVQEINTNVISGQKKGLLSRLTGWGN